MKSRQLGVARACIIFPDAQLKKAGLTLPALLMLAGFFPQTVTAVDRLYNPTLTSCTSIFSDTNCWDGGAVPGAGDNAVFNTSASTPYTVNFTAPASHDNGIVNTDSLIWDLGTNTYGLTSNLTVGQSPGDIANLQIRNGIVSSSQGIIGLTDGSTGTATVSGAGSSWTNSSDLFVGDYGTGILNIDSGGSVSNTNGYLGYYGDGSGTATVSGVGSTWTNTDSLYIGGSATAAGGTGVVNVNTGGSVDVTNLIKVWAGGTVNLTGVR
jgi:T5SS/PEP-CTERM-associated repeat protein